MTIIRNVFRAVIRFAIFWAVSALSLMLTAWILPGIDIYPVDGRPPWAVAVAAAFILGLVNLLIRPLILLLAIPLGFVVLFVVGLFVNAVMLMITAHLMGDGLVVSGWFTAFTAGLALALISALISAVLGVEDAGSFYEGVIERRLAGQRHSPDKGRTMGLVMLEIDGLSYHHLRKAVADGYMPHVRSMIERGGYVLSRVDCGLPSQTSACQAGIFFGNNYDIPAFRWFDKARDKLYVSGSDAAEINARFANGRGLLRGGASINNMLNGDAAQSLLTASDLLGGTDEQKRARAHDVYLLLLNPNFFMRVVGLYIGETLREVGQYLRDVLTGVQPRLNRLSHFYPFVRAATTVFMREVSGMLTIMQIVRGEPVIYTTWPGYDEVAHHSGPWSRHAFGTLRGYDRFIDSVRHIIETKAPRPYELIILSDHGQSFGATFKMRYGYTLKDFIQRWMPIGTIISQTAGGDDGSLAMASTVAELDNIQAQGIGGRVGQAAARQMQKAAESAAREKDKEHDKPEPAADVTFCGSGNLAQVYFHNFGHRASLGELNAAFPGMVDALIGHEGVGLVVATGDDGAPLAFGKGGARDLRSGEVRGEDPLAIYGDVDLRAWQVGRLADFPSAGDLILISEVYPDGSVAALEELIGNHGGLGGEQTDAFLLHPADMVIPPTRNSVDLFALLNARRNRPAPPPSVKTRNARDDWDLASLTGGLREGREWLGLALSTLIFDRSAYRAVATLGAMTGPALLISLAGVFVSVLMESPFTGAGELAGRFAGRYGLWLLTVAVTHAAARALRGSGNFTQTFRVMGFAQMVNLLELFRAFTVIDPLILAAVTIISFCANWLAVTEAHRLRGWRTLILPLLYLGILIAAGLWFLTLSGGLSFALETLRSQFEFWP